MVIGLLLISINGPVPTKDMQNSPPPLLLRSDHLDIEDAHCAENKYGRKTSYLI